MASAGNGRSRRVLDEDEVLRRLFGSDDFPLRLERAGRGVRVRSERRPQAELR